jgi:hypothetical protein
MTEKELNQIQKMIETIVNKAATAISIGLAERFDKIEEAISALDNNKNHQP